MALTSAPSNRFTFDKSFSSSSPSRFTWRVHATQNSFSRRQTYSLRSPSCDKRACASCRSSPHPRISAMDKHNGDGEQIFNTASLCPPCAAARLDHMRNKWTKLGTSSMDQADIVKKTRNIFRESGRVPQIHEVDPLATVTEIENWSGLGKTQESKPCAPASPEEKSPLKVFFAEDASELFAVPTADVGPVATRPDSVVGSMSLDIEEQEIPVGAGNELPWIEFSPESHTSFAHFFDTWRPSKCSQADVSWICVRNPRRSTAYTPLAKADVLKVRQVWEDMCASDKTSRPDIEGLGRQFGNLAGKWLVFVPPSEVDHLWQKIARATHAGTLGIYAKVSPFNDYDHVICVFTEDFTNVQNVNQVRKGLERLGVRTKISYKPDIYTHCHIFMGNKWDIAPTRYHG